MKTVLLILLATIKVFMPVVITFLGLILIQFIVYQTTKISLYNSIENWLLGKTRKNIENKQEKKFEKICKLQKRDIKSIS